MAAKAIQIPWYSLRSAVVASDTPIATFNYASWPTSNTFKLHDYNQVPGSENTFMGDARRAWIAFWGKAAALSTSRYTVYAIRKMNGPILTLATGVITLGTQVVTANPITGIAASAYWADTLTIDGGLWVDLGMPVVDSGFNRIAVLRGRVEGLSELYCEIALATGGGTTATEISAIITGTEDL